LSFAKTSCFTSSTVNKYPLDGFKKDLSRGILFVWMIWNLSVGLFLPPEASLQKTILAEDRMLSVGFQKEHIPSVVPDCLLLYLLRYVVLY
jgi:hypothetical protein